MADLSVKIEKYVGRKINWPHECSLKQQPDGSIVIERWDIDSHAQPTMDQLAAYDNAADEQVAANRFAATRRNAYPSTGDQLDMLWHAIDTGDWTAAKVKTTDFYTQLKAVKDANPKSQKNK